MEADPQAPRVRFADVYQLYRDQLLQRRDGKAYIEGLAKFIKEKLCRVSDVFRNTGVALFNNKTDIADVLGLVENTERSVALLDANGKPLAYAGVERPSPDVLEILLICGKGYQISQYIEAAHWTRGVQVIRLEAVSTAVARYLRWGYNFRGDPEESNPAAFYVEKLSDKRVANPNSWVGLEPMSIEELRRLVAQLVKNDNARGGSRNYPRFEKILAQVWRRLCDQTDQPDVPLKDRWYNYKELGFNKFDHAAYPDIILAIKHLLPLMYANRVIENDSPSYLVAMFKRLDPNREISMPEGTRGSREWYSPSKLFYRPWECITERKLRGSKRSILQIFGSDEATTVRAASGDVLPRNMFDLLWERVDQYLFYFSEENNAMALLSRGSDNNNAIIYVSKIRHDSDSELPVPEVLFDAIRGGHYGGFPIVLESLEPSVNAKFGLGFVPAGDGQRMKLERRKSPTRRV